MPVLGTGRRLHLYATSRRPGRGGEVTPETRAARDRIAAYLDARAPWATREGIDFLPDGIAYLSDPFDVQLNEGDLRTVLAALEPAGVVVIDGTLTEAEFEDLKREWQRKQTAAHGTVRVLDEPERASCADCGRPIQYINHAGWPAGWMHILEAHDHEARPANPETSDDSPAKGTP